MEAFADQAPRERPGRLLAAERERQGLGPADIAQRLHMSVSQIEALEADDYARLPRGPFLRGFVRNYAKAIGLAPDALLTMLAEGAPREPVHNIVVPTQNIRFEPLGDRMSSPYVRAAAIAAFVLSVGFAAMYWWLFIRNAPPAASARKAAADAVATAPTPTPIPAPAPAQVSALPVAPQGALPVAPQSPATPVAPPPKSTVDTQAKPDLPVAAAPKLEPPKPQPPKVEPAKAEPVRAEPAKAEPPKMALATPVLQKTASNGTTLKLRFKGKAWVEIKDAGGRVLMTGLNDPGSEAEVTGKPPFKVVVGNAPEVRLFLNDREFDLAPHMREAVARVTVE